MEDAPEVIRQQMEDTRASLSEKLESLEQQVVGTVHDARDAVADTVQSVKDAFDIKLQTRRHPLWPAHYLRVWARTITSPSGRSRLGRSAGRYRPMGQFRRLRLANNFARSRKVKPKKSK